MGCSLSFAGFGQVGHELCVAALHDLNFPLLILASLADLVFIVPEALVHPALSCREQTHVSASMQGERERDRQLKLPNRGSECKNSGGGKGEGIIIWTENIQSLIDSQRLIHIESQILKQDCWS